MEVGSPLRDLAFHTSLLAFTTRTEAKLVHIVLSKSTDASALYIEPLSDGFSVPRPAPDLSDCVFDFDGTFSPALLPPIKHTTQQDEDMKQTELMLNLCDTSMRTQISSGFKVEQLRLLLLKSLGPYDLSNAPNGLTTTHLVIQSQTHGVLVLHTDHTVFLYDVKLDGSQCALLSQFNTAGIIFDSTVFACYFCAVTTVGVEVWTVWSSSAVSNTRKRPSNKAPEPFLALLDKRPEPSPLTAVDVCICNGRIMYSERSPLMAYGSRDCREGEWSNVVDVLLPHAVTVCTHCMETAKDLSGSAKTEMLRSCYWLLMTATADYTGIDFSLVQPIIQTCCSMLADHILEVDPIEAAAFYILSQQPIAKVMTRMQVKKNSSKALVSYLESALYGSCPNVLEGIETVADDILGLYQRLAPYLFSRLLIESDIRGYNSATALLLHEEVTTFSPAAPLLSRISPRASPASSRSLSPTLSVKSISDSSAWSQCGDDIFARGLLYLSLGREDDAVHLLRSMDQSQMIQFCVDNCKVLNGSNGTTCNDHVPVPLSFVIRENNPFALVEILLRVGPEKISDSVSADILRHVRAEGPKHYDIDSIDSSILVGCYIEGLLVSYSSLSMERSEQLMIDLWSLLSNQIMSCPLCLENSSRQHRSWIKRFSRYQFKPCVTWIQQLQAVAADSAYVSSSASTLCCASHKEDVDIEIIQQHRSLYISKLLSLVSFVLERRTELSVAFWSRFYNLCTSASSSSSTVLASDVSYSIGSAHNQVHLIVGILSAVPSMNRSVESVLPTLISSYLSITFEYSKYFCHTLSEWKLVVDALVSRSHGEQNTEQLSATVRLVLEYLVVLYPSEDFLPLLLHLQGNDWVPLYGYIRQSLLVAQQHRDRQAKTHCFDETAMLQTLQL
eukprot:GILJ01015181.1.p1 GENE.GILJ01015181.1~~GILJ01015181.1.p1  ORF type:complete len:1050 (+),score=139.71 GILJ01015181.1:455-3151(+)